MGEKNSPREQDGDGRVRLMLKVLRYTVENLGWFMPQGSVYQETKRTDTGVILSNRKQVDLLVNLPIVLQSGERSNELQAPPTWLVYKERVKLLRSVTSPKQHRAHHIMERTISYVNDDTRRRIETLRRKLYRDRYCSPCQQRLTTSKEFKEHSWQHFVLVVCNCGTTDSRVRFIKLHQKKAPHQSYHLYKVDHVSWGHLRSTITSLPSAMPQLPKITRIYEILQAARETERTSHRKSIILRVGEGSPVEEKKVSSSAEARQPTPSPIVIEDEDPDFIDLTKPIEESTIVDLTGGASSAADNDREQYILDLHAEEEYEEKLLR